ncbi:MAG: DUF3164 family protein [Paracoccus sp. (in: a-proteobacteria)]|uniref:DUF3164 family protein n=1 Tax=Paracoccus sp. TaxID=267 RepID=UPI0026DED97C|nr:DUF3164 family protein [Paracoccus sp. (in: a-proteobacteria)]MDO5622564.1 DUF3164 family protein [Paracoccus sp. (in: a-proteobacteria)]
MQDGKGALVPVELIKPQVLLEDETVRKIIGFGLALSEQIARFKAHTFTDLGDFDALLAQQYQATKGGAKGNRTYQTHDALMKVEIRIADLIDFGPELQIAKALVDECLNEWAADARAEIRAVVIATNVKGLLDEPEFDEIAAKRLISELLNNLIKIQAEQVAMQRAVAALEQEQRQADQFQAEAIRYRPKRTEQGSFVYELQPTHANGEPIHCICAACYNKKIKSILQPVQHNTFECGTCGGRVFMPDGQGSGIMVGRVPRDDRFDGWI